MSTEPSTTYDSQLTDARTTEISARGTDPWATEETNEAADLTAADAPQQFDPLSLARMRNLMDDDNAYCR
ncbi:hypothetical protein HWV23_07205 [Natronomonas halophila]|uniref:hypothetical protein n=1 Tax=Natronomonas halophila TaxID=2747817 RepID=UPI0015B4EA7E|nr:hypothetical protein [Natronomonas halophila]QLD85520.1 hypothetical protein HWV23_07205 [Natronomonas halophila]